MRKYLTGLAGAMMLSTASVAMAAEPGPMPMTYDWTGPYIGIHGGWGWNNESVSITPADAGTTAFWAAATAAGALLTSLDPDADGILGGAQAGYNWQASANFLIGVEVDFSITDIQGTTTVTTAGIPGFVNGTHQASIDLDWLATLRARLGVLAGPNALFYVTGGLAIGNAEASFSAAFPGSNDFFAGSGDENFGFAGGVGGEFKFGDGWGIGGEYLYVNLGDIDFTTVGAGRALAIANSNFNSSVDADFHIIRLKINKHFMTR